MTSTDITNVKILMNVISGTALHAANSWVLNPDPIYRKTILAHVAQPSVLRSFMNAVRRYWPASPFFPLKAMLLRKRSQAV
jgi:hypothetical protein